MECEPNVIFSYASGTVVKVYYVLNINCHNMFCHFYFFLNSYLIFIVFNISHGDICYNCSVKNFDLCQSF